MSLKIGSMTVSIGDKEILKNVSLEILPGKLHVLMGPNGSGKSTLAAVLMGNPNYNVAGTKVKISLNSKNITDKDPDERANIGLFLAFQNPIAIPGVSVANLLKMAYMEKYKGNGVKKSVHNPALSIFQFNHILSQKAQELGIKREFLGRSLNEDFSGGEKKKLEMLQASILKPKYAVFDEIDTGLDVDALKIIANEMVNLKKEGTGILVITHYNRILQYAHPDFVHVLINGKIAISGDDKLARQIEKEGYKNWTKEKKN